MSISQNIYRSRVHYTIEIEQAYLAVNIQKGTACCRVNGDRCDFHKATCDPYVKVFINGKMVCRTKTYHDAINIQFDVRCTTSPMRIPKNAKIVLEMWDWDLIGPDDFMERFTFNFTENFHFPYEVKTLIGDKKRIISKLEVHNMLIVRPEYF